MIKVSHWIESRNFFSLIRGLSKESSGFKLILIEDIFCAQFDANLNL